MSIIRYNLISMSFETVATNTTSYKVATPIYEGPLDLLLQLIERAELDITKLALSEITDQFLDYLKILDEYSPSEVSSFLVIAARLMQIKSEALLPRPPQREPGEEDPSDALIQQLLVYKRYKEIATYLREQEELGAHTYLRLAPPPKVEGKLDLSEVSINDLASAAMRAFARANDVVPLGIIARKPKVTIREKIALITTALRKKHTISFKSLLTSNHNRTEIIMTFLAMLELIKRFIVVANQETRFGDINLVLLEEMDNISEFELEFTE